MKENIVFHKMIPLSVAAYLERFEYEKNGVCHLCKWLDTAKIDNKLRKEKKEECEALYNEIIMSQQIAKEQLLKMYVPQNYHNDRYSLYVNYEDCGVFIIDNLPET